MAMKLVSSALLWLASLQVAKASSADDACLTILLTNDDGYETLYVNTLFAHLRDDTCHRVVMAAPKGGQSGMSAAVEILTPVEIGNPSEDVYFVDSTPFIATLYGLDHVLPSLGIDAPDLVISGPNEGWNIGITSLNSGTVAAAASALQRDLPAIAVSGSIYDHESVNAEEGALVIAQLVVKLVETKLLDDDGSLLLAGGEGLNVNIPSITNDDTGFVGALDDYAFQLTKIGRAPTGFGTKFYADMGESYLGSLFGLSGLSGLSIVFPYTAAGYPLDADPNSEGNAIGPVLSIFPDRTGEDPLYAVTVSPMEFTLETPALSLFDGEDQVPPPSPTCLNILLTNDDGYETLYINTLFEYLRNETCHEVVMAAPMGGQSGMSAAVELLTPFKIGNPDESVYFVNATPYTSTLYGLDHVLPLLDIKPDLVISGPNEGWNIGITSLNSGTVAAAASAMQRGLPAIAVSGSIYDHESVNAQEGALVIAQLVVKLVETKLIGEDGSLLLAGGEGLNVNIPSITNDDTGFVGALDDYTFQLTKIGSATTGFGTKFYADMGESYLGSLFGLSGLSGLSIDFPYTAAGYPLDADPSSEGNAIGPVLSISPDRTGEDPLYAVTVSPMEFTLETPAPARVKKAFSTCNNDNDCLGVHKCKKNPNKCKCRDMKCRKKKKDCATRGFEMEWWGCRNGEECTAEVKNVEGETWKWGKCK